MTTNQTSFENERILHRVPLEVLGLSLIISILILVLFDPLTALLFFWGGGVSALNFIWLRKTSLNILHRNKRKALTLGIFFYILRILLICSIFFIIIFFLSERIVAFVAGLSTIILIFLAEAGRALATQSKWKR